MNENALYDNVLVCAVSLELLSGLNWECVNGGIFECERIQIRF